MNIIIQKRTDKLIKENNDLIAKYKSLFNGGENDGDVTIICKNGEVLHAHSEVLEATSEYYNNIKSTFYGEKSLSFENYCAVSVKALLNLLYNETYSDVYHDSSEIICHFFELSELLLLMSKLDKRIQQICNDYIKWINRKVLICINRYNFSSGISLLKMMGTLDNKYFNQLRTEILKTGIAEIAKMYLVHNSNILNNSLECKCNGTNCAFIDNYLYKEMQLKAIEYLAIKCSS